MSDEVKTPRHEINSIHTLQSGRRLPSQAKAVDPGHPNVKKLLARLKIRKEQFEKDYKAFLSSGGSEGGMTAPGSMRLQW